MTWADLAEFIKTIPAIDRQKRVQVQSDPVESGEPPFPPQFATTAIQGLFGGYADPVLFVLPKE